jgi:hypothetical protein
MDHLGRKMKMKHEPVVPLSRQAIVLLRQVQALTGGIRYADDYQVIWHEAARSMAIIF